MYNLSKNFNIDEMCVSSSYPNLASEIILTSSDMLSAQVLAITCLQPIRDRWGQINVSSWFRSKKLNKIVGGTVNSDHLLGCAADIKPVNFNIEEIYRWIIKCNVIPYRQVILYPKFDFIHISCNHPLNKYKHESLVLVEKKYIPSHDYYGN